ncbi:MAG: peroxide stress protein YaaA [Bacteroidota bacterium]
MILLLSPAKTLDFSDADLKKHTEPRLLEDSDKLVKVLKKKSADDLKSLMKVSDNIASLNVARFKEFSTPFTTENAKQSILAFKGDVYQGLAADTFGPAEHEFAQKHLRILSGLYGILRPMDLMQPYRLEMGTKLKNGKYKNLYEFWDNRITNVLNEDLKNSCGNTIVNLASQEYFKSVKVDKLEGDLLNIHFKEKRGDKFKVIAFNAKKARGAMAKQVIELKITDKEHLKALEVNGYVFNEGMSDEGNYMFVKE